MNARAQVFGPFSAALPGALAGNGVRGGVSRTWTWALMRCQHRRWRLTHYTTTPTPEMYFIREMFSGKARQEIGSILIYIWSSRSNIWLLGLEKILDCLTCFSCSYLTDLPNRSKAKIQQLSKTATKSLSSKRGLLHMYVGIIVYIAYVSYIILRYVPNWFPENRNECWCWQEWILTEGIL